MDNMIIILTGSTGSLGSYLLDVLHRDERVHSINCINGSIDAAKRHANSRAQRRLCSLDSRRVGFLQGDLSLPQFGLSEPHYEGLLLRTTHLMHNQWPVNFNYSLETFDPWIQGTDNLINFTVAAEHRPFIFFTSSISAAGAWDLDKKVPECPVHDDTVAALMGSGRSKQLGERLLDAAARTSGIPSACCRVGVIAGPADSALGQWNESHYVPSIFISSAHPGVFPSEFPSRNSVNWLPVDRTARILVEQLMHCDALTSDRLCSGTQIFHALNPQPTTWIDVARTATALYKPYNVHVELTSFAEWLARVQKSGVNPRNPAFKLLDFYTGLQQRDKVQRWALKKSMAASSTLATIEPVHDAWIENWMHQWRHSIGSVKD